MTLAVNLQKTSPMATGLTSDPLLGRAISLEELSNGKILHGTSPEAIKLQTVNKRFEVRRLSKGCRHVRISTLMKPHPDPLGAFLTTLLNVSLSRDQI
jgi:hypothetical protein